MRAERREAKDETMTAHLPCRPVFQSEKESNKTASFPCCWGLPKQERILFLPQLFLYPIKNWPLSSIINPPPCHRRSDPYLVQSSRLAAFGRWWRGWIIIPSRKCDFVLATKEVPSCALRTGTCKTQNKKHVAFICAGVQQYISSKTWKYLYAYFQAHTCFISLLALTTKYTQQWRFKPLMHIIRHVSNDVWHWHLSKVFSSLQPSFTNFERVSEPPLESGNSRLSRRTLYTISFHLRLRSVQNKFKSLRPTVR